MSDAAILRNVSTISAEGARRALSAALEAAEERALKLSIAIVDAGGHLVAFERMNGSMLVSAEVSIAKARSAAYLGAPTRSYQEMIENGRPALTTLKNVTLVRGGVPIMMGGVVVGAVGGSGGTGEEDEYAAYAGAAAIGGILPER